MDLPQPPFMGSFLEKRKEMSYNYQTSTSRSSPVMSRTISSSRDRDKAEQELFTSVKKAVNVDETAPKQKHVRVATLFTWDFHKANSFWQAIKIQPVLSDDVQCFKSLITIHKVMRDGHPCALEETMREVPYLDTISRSFSHTNGIRGYSSLIQAYVQFIKAKLEFHTFHPEFTANLDYEEYRALRKVDDLNEGYNTISELMTLQDKLDQLQRSVFASFRPSSHNECRIAALVPLVEESYGIYKFITSMLFAMHAAVASHAALEPLRTRYYQQYKVLRTFYQECSSLRYLTSLITVPNLPATPPDFTNSGASNSKSLEDLTPREKTPPPEDLWGSITSMTPEPSFALTGPLPSSKSHEEINQQQMMLVQQRQVYQNNAMENELNILRQQNVHAQQLLAGYEGRVIDLEHRLRGYEQTIAQYENKMVSMSNFDAERSRQDNEKDALIRSLQEQVAMWKSKYENIATMYASLRKEHLDLLSKYKEMQRLASSAELVTQEKEKYAQLVKIKTGELSELVKERDQWKNEVARVQDVTQDEISMLRRQVAEHQAHFQELSHSRGAETEKLVAQFTLEKQQQEARFLEQQGMLEQIRNDFRLATSEAERLRMENAARLEEIAALQAGLEQSISALKNMQQKGSDKEADLLVKLNSLSLEHRSQMDKIMDSVLEDCKGKTSDAVFEMDSEAHPGNQTATAELLLSMLEKLTGLSNEFASSFVKHLTGGDTSGDQQAEAIKHANNLAQAIYLLLNNAKGVTRLAGDDKAVENIISQFKSVAVSGKKFFVEMQSSQLSKVDFTKRPTKVQQCNSELQSTLQPVIKLTESLIPRDVSNVNTGDDIDNIIENEMGAAAKAIQDAAMLLAKLLSEDRSGDPKLTQIDLQVHQSILSSAKAITDAIGRLIICATHTQQEIVANGKGSGTKTAFYKKNSRWVEGLISAAKTVATATKTLVEAADGVVHGTHKIEQLVVAAHEVAAATAQLVAASRVKAIRGSKTQDKLEGAAKAVTDATKSLVKVVEEIRNRDSQQKVKDIDFSKLSVHDFKKQEMEQQVRILTLEKNLTDARRQLSDMRKVGYHQEAEYVPE